MKLTQLLGPLVHMHILDITVVKITLRLSHDSA